MKTINYELAKKLYDAWVVIDSKNSWYKMSFLDDPFVAQNNLYTENFEYKFPAPNVEEVIEFLLPFCNISIQKWEYVYMIIIWENFAKEFKKETLLEALEATLEYLLDNGYIWNQNF